MDKLNNSIRLEFKEFRAVHFEPSNRVLASIIDIDYSYLMQWQKGNIDLGYTSLNKIKQFLSNHNKK